ncbi:TlpA disulfide reductase family protein [Nocardioides daphniae]|uniref:TlpA disulfide reductase family protein n=1 Tax=Nocardioides daphniae TaxID=402297 RepID=UPI001315110D|nr:TlpA disulfide reductase family protein [Nocardioides daphniae]
MVLLAIVLTGCSASDSGSPTATSSVVEQIAPEDRVEVEPFTGTQLDGEPFDSRDLAGQVVVYNVWGSWCAPCRTEAPALARVSRANEDNGVQFIGINVRDNDAAPPWRSRTATTSSTPASAPTHRAQLSWPSDPHYPRARCPARWSSTTEGDSLRA